MRKTIAVLLATVLLFSPLWAQDKPYRILNSFSAGELSELLNAREDLSKYHSGCSVMENMLPLPQGGAQKRPGTVYVAGSKSNTKIRLLPFEYSTEQPYIIELGNQYMRFYANGAQITGSTGTEDLSGVGSITAHWLLNDNLATTAVLDDDGGTYNGVATSNTDTLHQAGMVGTGCFDLGGSDAIEVADNAAFTFDDTGSPGAASFSITAWVYVTTTGVNQRILSKFNQNAKREWMFEMDGDKKLKMNLADQSLSKYPSRLADDAMDDGWHFVVMVYDNEDASYTPATAANFIVLYVDGAAVASTASNEATYAGMEDLAGKVAIGANYNASEVLFAYWADKIDTVSIHSKALSASEVDGLYTSGTVYEIATPYLTADLFELRYEQSADVLYITHPDYESRKLSRTSSAGWTLEALALQGGPFRTQNTTAGKTIAADGTTGSVTLTAVGHSPFVATATTGHVPNGSAATDKSQTGALFRLIHPLTDLVITTQTLTDKYGAGGSVVENTSWMDLGTLYKGAGWTLTTEGTWTGTFEIQRNYVIGATHDASGWEKVMQFKSADDRNASTTGTEDIDDASYRAILVDSGDNAESCAVYFSTDQTEHIGIVKITAVASGTSATATVLTTLGSTDATHKWSEGSWSNYRGWPRTVTFFEDRLTFGGNGSEPDTIWASVTADYENMLEGVEDDDALIFTLSSRQVNVIEWLVGKDKILIGTSGAEWTLGGSSDEPLTPSNVKAEQHSTYGSANLQATLASESVLFFQRGAEKMRELAYNWESDSYVAPDMTILIPEVTGDGITDTTFQKTPNSILWCVKENGDLATFTYERKELITSWSRIITDDDFESVAVITGDPEDEVWVSVKRVIGGSTKRYIEYFSDRDFGTDIDDAFYVDSGVTYDSTATTTITGLTHLNGETVAVLGDGVVQTSQVVSGGQITITSASTVQAGLPFTVQLRTMPLSWIASGATIQGKIKRINEVIARYWNSGDFDVGRDATTKESISISSMDTDENRITFPAGYDRPGYVFVYQQSPEPLTLLALMIEFMIY